MLKLNINENTGRARLGGQFFVEVFVLISFKYQVLRTDGVLRLVLNAALFKGMDFSLGADPRYVKFGLVEDKKIVLYTLRVSLPSSRVLIPNVDTRIVFNCKARRRSFSTCQISYIRT